MKNNDNKRKKIKSSDAFRTENYKVLKELK